MTTRPGDPAMRPAGASTTLPQRPAGVGVTTRRPGRRARLVVRRVDPWSVLKLSFVYSLAALVILLVAVVVLYAVVDALGVIDSVRSFLTDVTDNGSGTGASVTAWFGFGRVLIVAAVVGVVNVVLFTALATLGAFLYNVTSEMVGGVEVTLADRS